VSTAPYWNIKVEPSTTEQKEQADACITDYLNGLHAALFDALTKTRNVQSNDIRAQKIVEILQAARGGK